MGYSITSGIITSAQKVVVYGTEGIGKSTFASRFPNPVFIDTEGSTKGMSVSRLPAPDSWDMLLNEVQYVATEPARLCDTLVIDTADWAEALCIRAICERAEKRSIEDFGYGKGYTFIGDEFIKLLKLLDTVIERGIHVCITAHAKIGKFDQPDEFGSYNRYEMKLSKFAAPLLKEWADMLLFANYKVFTVRDEDKKVKAQGGDRVLYTTHHPCWDAKNRHGLEPELRFTYESIRHCIEPQETAPAQQTASPAPAPSAPQSFASVPPQVSFTQLEPQTGGNQDTALTPPESGQREPDIPSGTPQALAALMRQNTVDAAEIQMVVYDKGYYPLDTQITAYDPDFVQAVLVGAWNQVYACILENRKKLPF